MAEYPPPVAALLELGEVRLGEKWRDYQALGLGREHVADLTRLVLDEEQYAADGDSPVVWGPIHALRALGQLQAVETMPALLEARRRAFAADDDWVPAELHKVAATMGPGVLPALLVDLDVSLHDVQRGWHTAEVIAAVAERHPETRDECVAALTAALERLEHAGDGDELPTLRGGIIACLLDLDAVEAAPLIERVFATGHVDTFVAGDWPDVHYALSLGPSRPRRPPLFDPRPLPDQKRTPSARAKERAQERRRMAKQSKKKNRKKK